MNITLKEAREAVNASLKKAEELNVKMNISVVDFGANLVAFARMDGAWLGSKDISMKKAKTAKFFDMNTGEIGKLSQPGGSLYNIEHSNNGLITFPGG
ncbi:GlcG/HbpS family heme-binding protein, partial [Mycoplasma todarodis]